MLLKSSDFFDLSNFAHAKLFEEGKFPWEALSQIESYLHSLPLGVIEGDVSPQAYLINPEFISIGEGSIVEPGAYIQGPCWIGKNCVVRHGAYIRGNVITGDGCVIGHDTEVKSTIFLNKAHAAHFAYIGDSILGNEVNLGAGVKCANFKLDKQTINIHFQNERVPTQLRKLGALIGDRTQLGCNTVTNPGTLIGKEVRGYPGLNFGGYIPSRSILKSDARIQVTSY
jgi:NDP-sugar pyrophosphorylase family protein